jgi:hypothetical protein
VNLTWTAPGDDYDHGRGETDAQTLERRSPTKQRLCWEEEKTEGGNLKWLLKLKAHGFLNLRSRPS